MAQAGYSDNREKQIWITEKGQTLWTFQNPSSFLLTFSELLSLSEDLQPLANILRPISSDEGYSNMHAFNVQNSEEMLERSKTCASCGLMVRNNSIPIHFSNHVNRLFSHKNCCRAVFNPLDIELENDDVDHQPNIFKPKDAVILTTSDGNRYPCKVVYQRRGIDDDAGLVALRFPQSSPNIPPCPNDRSCPYFTQRHGFKKHG